MLWGGSAFTGKDRPDLLLRDLLGVSFGWRVRAWYCETSSASVPAREEDCGEVGVWGRCDGDAERPGLELGVPTSRETESQRKRCILS